MFKKGDPKPPTSGKKKGTLNKSTATCKEAFELAFEGVGGIEALTKWALENPTDFFKLYSKILPQDINAKIKGAIETHVKVDIVDKC